MKKKVILQDPISFSVYDLTINKEKRRIVLIGEIHEMVSCPGVSPSQRLLLSDFIEQYHRSIGTKNVLDIFTESFYIRSKKLGWLPTLHYLLSITFRLNDVMALSYIRKRLDPCSPKYNFSLYECPENMRIHLCDVRFVKEMDYSWKYSNKKDCLTDKLFKIGLSYIYPQKIPRAYYAFSRLVSFVKKFLFDKKSQQYHTRLSEYIFSYTKIKKQLENISSPKIHSKLLQWSSDTYRTHLAHARKQFILFAKIYEKDKNIEPIGYVSEQCIHLFTRNISLPILYMISVFMDLYLMARLLRTFEDSTYAKNSIVYVGEFHAKEYRNLLKKLGAKQIFHKTSLRGLDYISCVDISRFYHAHISPKKK